MLLGEPPRTQYDLNFILFGIPVRIHPFFWLVSAILGLGGLGEDMRMAIVRLLIWMAAVFVSILIHELGHAMMMRRYGYSPSITLYGMGGLASAGTPSGPRARREGPLDQILISLAGPGAGFALAGLIVLLLLATGHTVLVGLLAYVAPIAQTDSIQIEILGRFVNDMLWICLLWGFVNLLPVYPLDGGQVAREVLLMVDSRTGVQRSLTLSIATGAGVAALALLGGDFYVALMFGYLAYSSYTTLQHYSNHWR